jgi:calcineurin-like phosphoesterase
MQPAIIVARFLDGLPRRFEVADGPVQFNSVLIDVDEATGLARSIERVDRLWEA